MKKRRIVLWAFLVVLLVVAGWAIVSKNPFAQAFQEVLGSQPDEPVMKGSFVIGPRGFRYYTFSLPSDSKNVLLVGNFTVSPVSGSGQISDATPAAETGSEIELYVFNESSFSEWQRGAASHPVFATGRTSTMNIHQELPSGSGIYYIVFSNRFDSEKSKKLTAEARLHHGSWLHH